MLYSFKVYYFHNKQVLYNHNKYMFKFTSFPQVINIQMCSEHVDTSYITVYTGTFVF